MIKIEENHVGAVCATNKLHCKLNIINNYNRQTYENKMLIVILNNNGFDIDEFDNLCQEHGTTNYRVLQIDEKKALGHCLNVAVDILHKLGCTYFTKFDDDDYYGEMYIGEMVNAFQKSGADVVGKPASLAYIPERKGFYTLSRYHRCKQNCFQNFIFGATISFPIEYVVSNNIRFHDTRPNAVDSDFLNKVRRIKGKIYATTKHNYIWIRHSNTDFHTWKQEMRTLSFSKYKNDVKYKELLKGHVFF